MWLHPYLYESNVIKFVYCYVVYYMFFLIAMLTLLQEVKVGEQLEESGENVFVGGKNRWK